MDRRRARGSDEGQRQAEGFGPAVSGAFVEAVRHSSTAPPGWLWLHIAGMADDPPPPMRRLGEQGPGAIATRREALQRRLEDLAPGETRPPDEILALAEEVAVVVGAEVWRVAGVQAPSESIRLDDPQDEEPVPEEVRLDDDDRAARFGALIVHLRQRVELPLLHLHVEGTRVTPVDALRRALAALGLMEQWLAEHGPDGLDDAAELWEAVEALAQAR